MGQGPQTPDESAPACEADKVKFIYEYQDKANKRHKGSLNAATRADAYAALKAQGIKPIRCEEAPGFFNLLFGKGKRWLAIGFLAVVCVSLAIVVGRGVLTAPQPSSVEESLDSPIRRQIIGDAAIIEKSLRTGWSDVFELEGDRFLASFAIPGVPPVVRTTTEEKLREALETQTLGNSTTQALEARQIRAIVSGMKREISGLLKDGWTLREVGTALANRQEQEIGYYERAKTEIETAAKSKMAPGALEDLLDRRNDSLRKLGIRPVSMPE